MITITIDSKTRCKKCGKFGCLDHALDDMLSKEKRAQSKSAKAAPPVPLARARAIADRLVARLDPVCDRVLVAGSIRRKRATVSDIDIVCIPRWETKRDLFGDPYERVSLLDGLLDELAGGIGVELITNGPRVKRLRAAGVTIEINACTVDTWGVIATIRTGSSDFATWLVTPRDAGGAMPDGLRIHDGRVIRGSVALATPGEMDVFNALGIEWVEPSERKAGLWPRQ